MNRRRFLSFIGLAPVAAALPTMALPRPDNVKDTVKPTVDMDYAIGSVELEKPLIFKDGKLQINLAHIKQITGERDIHERVEGDRIIREGGERRYTVTL